VLSQWYPPEPGPASLPGVLARALTARGHKVTVVTGFPNYPTGHLVEGYRLRRRLDEHTDDGIRIRRVALYPSHDRSLAERALNYGSFAVSATVGGARLLRDVDACWVYNSPATVGLPSAVVSGAGGPPHLMHVMDLWPDSITLSRMIEPGTHRRGLRALSAWCDWTYQRAAAIACISDSVVDQLEARGVPRRKLHHIPVWTDEEIFFPRPRDAPLARRLGVSDDFTLLYAGNLGEAQGIEGLLEVCARLSDLDGFRCLIAGSGIAEKGLRTLAAGLKLTNVEFLGRWPAESMGDLLSIGDLHIVSLSADPLGNMTTPSKLPAILASGRAVLAVAGGDTANTVERAGAGWAVAPGDLDGLESALRHAHALGRPRMRPYEQSARRYYERCLALSSGVDAVEKLLQEIYLCPSPGQPGRGRVGQGARLL
jgi:colanic acid biosynthesis glycosyl transferase WcaI